MLLKRTHTDDTTLSKRSFSDDVMQHSKTGVLCWSAKLDKTDRINFCRTLDTNQAVMTTRGMLREGNCWVSALTDTLTSCLMLRYGTNCRKQTQDNHWDSRHHRPQYILRARAYGEEAFFWRCLLEYSKYSVFNKKKKNDKADKGTEKYIPNMGEASLKQPRHWTYQTQTLKCLKGEKMLKGNQRPEQAQNIHKETEIITTKQNFWNWKVQSWNEGSLEGCDDWYWLPTWQDL